LTSKQPGNHHYTRLTSEQTALLVFLGHAIPNFLTIAAQAMLHDSSNRRISSTCLKTINTALKQLQHSACAAAVCAAKNHYGTCPAACCLVLILSRTIHATANRICGCSST
jgi:hypothetical protein